MKRAPIIAGNWKMYKTAAEAASFVTALAPLVSESSASVWIAPPFTAIHAAASAAKGTQITIGAQNMSDAVEGAFTGEISSRMLLEAGARFVLLGHSERRQLFHETDALIHRKLKRAFADELLPILCVGESEQERREGKTKQVLERQLSACLEGIDPQELVIAYEPLWAIGTGKTATPEIAQEAHAICRALLNRLWGRQISILYGGSVKPDHIADLMQMPDIDGVLVGGASLEVASFAKMVQNIP
jgi:triosephosphate isomerase